MKASSLGFVYFALAVLVTSTSAGERVQAPDSLLERGAVAATVATAVEKDPTAGAAPMPETAPERSGVTLVEADPRERDVERLIAFLAVRPTGLDAAGLRSLAECILDESQRHGLDPALVLALIHVESRFKPRAVSHAGAIGLMQLLPGTAEEQAGKLGLEWEGPDSLYDPVLNVRLGTAYVKRLQNRFGNLEHALAAYNAGPTRISRHLRSGGEIPRGYRTLVFAAYETTRLET